MSKKTTTSKSLKAASMLSVERSLNVTDGLLFAVKRDEAGEIVSRKPVLISERGLRATFSNASEKKNVLASKEAGKESNIARGNLKRTETAILPVGHPELEIGYEVSFHDNSLTPLACNEKDTREAMTLFTQLYGAKGGYKTLAERYVDNIAQGRPFWRNKRIANRCTVQITLNGDVFTFVTDDKVTTTQDDKSVLIEAVAAALSTKDGYTRLKVVGYMYMGETAEVFPSQVFEDNAKMKQLSYTRLSKEERQAIMHYQKLSNAIRTIDTWYTEDATYALPVEPFGIDKTLDVAWRVNNKTDLYTLLQDNLLGYIDALKTDEAIDAIDPNIHFVAACLVRGGVFSDKQ